MSSQEEEESQVHPLYSLHTVNMKHNLPTAGSQIPLEFQRHLENLADEQVILIDNRDEIIANGSTVGDVDEWTSAKFHGDEAQSFASVVEDTQFAHVEDETQPTDLSDPSQATLEVISDIEESIPSTPPPVMDTSFFIGRPEPEPNMSRPEFKFSKAPNPKTAMNLQRQNPGKGNTSQTRQVPLDDEPVVPDLRIPEMAPVTAARESHDTLNRNRMQENSESQKFDEQTRSTALNASENAFRQRSIENSRLDVNPLVIGLQGVSGGLIQDKSGASSSARAQRQRISHNTFDSAPTSLMINSVVMNKPFAGLELSMNQRSLRKPPSNLSTPIQRHKEVPTPSWLALSNSHTFSSTAPFPEASMNNSRGSFRIGPPQENQASMSTSEELPPPVPEFSSEKKLLCSPVMNKCNKNLSGQLREKATTPPLGHSNNENATEASTEVFAQKGPARVLEVPGSRGNLLETSAVFYQEKTGFESSHYFGLDHAQSSGNDVDMSIDSQMRRSIPESVVDSEEDLPRHPATQPPELRYQNDRPFLEPLSPIERVEHQPRCSPSKQIKRRSEGRPLTEDNLRPPRAAQSPISSPQQPFRATKSTRNRNSNLEDRRVFQERIYTSRDSTPVNLLLMPNPTEVLETSWQLFQLQGEALQNKDKCIERQNEQVRDLTATKTKLRKDIVALSSVNIEITAKVEVLQLQSTKYRDHVIYLTKDQKRLEKERKKLQTEVDDLRAEVVASAQEAAEKIQVMQVAFSEKSREASEEARLTISDQDTKIKVLRKDIDHRLNNYQREKGIAERLQKQLEDRTNFEEVLKGFIIEQQAQFDGKIDRKIASMSSERDGDQRRFEECLTLMKDFKKDNPPLHQKLEELLQTAQSLSVNVLTKFDVATSSTAQLHEAGHNILSAFNDRLELLQTDQEAKSRHNEEISEFNRRESSLIERLSNREMKIGELNGEVEAVRRDLSACQEQVSSLTGELIKASVTLPEDPLLRSQLTELQIVCSNLRDHIDAAKKEKAESIEELNAETEACRSMQQKLQELSAHFQQIKSKISEMEIEKSEILQSHKAETDRLRANLEHEAQTRSEEITGHWSELANLEKAKVQAEAHHFSQISDLEHQKLQAQNRHSTEITNLEEQKIHVEARSHAQAASFETQRLHCERERDKAMHLKTTAESELTHLRAEFSALQQCNTSNEAALRKLQADLSAVEVRIIKDIEKTELRDKVVRASQDLCDRILKEMQLEREDLESWKTEVLTWKDNFEECDRHLSHYIQESSTNQEKTAAELESLKIDSAHAMKASQDLQARLGRAKIGAEIQLHVGDAAGGNASVDRQLSRLRNYAYASSWKTDSDEQRIHHFEPKSLITGISGASPDAIDLTVSNGDSRSTFTSAHMPETMPRPMRSDGLVTYHSNTLVGALNSRMADQTSAKIIPDSQDAAFLAPMGSATSRRVALRPSKQHELLKVPDSKIEGLQLLGTSAPSKSATQRQIETTHTSQDGIKIWNGEMFDDLISSNQKLVPSPKVLDGETHTRGYFRQVETPEVHKNRRISALKTQGISQVTAQHLLDPSAGSSAPLTRFSSIQKPPITQKTAPKSILKKNDCDKAPNKSQNHVKHSSASAQPINLASIATKKTLSRPSIPSSQYNRPVRGKEPDNGNADPYDFPQSQSFGVLSTHKPKYAHMNQQQQPPFTAHQQPIALVAGFEMPRSLRRSSSIKAKRISSWVDADSEGPSKKAKT